MKGRLNLAIRANCKVRWEPKGGAGNFIEVWFVRLLLGHIEQNNLSFLRADIPPQEAGQKTEKNRNLKPNPVLPMF
jgi:hypothetical protein